MDDYDDERPSWREIDKRRDGSSHVRTEKQEKSTREGSDRWNTGRRKDALERLFKGEKGTVEYEKLYNKIHKAYGTSAFLPAIQKYVASYGLPDDVSTLLLVLDAKDTKIMMLAMEKLQQVYGGVSAREKEDIRRKLSIVALTERSIDVKEKAFEIGEDIKSRP